MAQVPQKTLNWLWSVLQPEYRNPQRAYSDTAQTLGLHPSLSPRTNGFTFDNGSSALLLKLSGTIPVNYRGATYRFPITIWLPHAYPIEPPLVYVTPTDDMIVRPGQHVSASDGKIYHPYLARWRDTSERSTVAEFVRLLSDVFAREPPVMARQQQQQQQQPLQSAPVTAIPQSQYPPQPQPQPPPRPPLPGQQPPPLQQSGSQSGPPQPPPKHHEPASGSRPSSMVSRSDSPRTSRYDAPPPLPGQGQNQASASFTRPVSMTSPPLPETSRQPQQTPYHFAQPQPGSLRASYHPATNTQTSSPPPPQQSQPHYQQQSQPPPQQHHQYSAHPGQQQQQQPPHHSHTPGNFSVPPNSQVPQRPNSHVAPAIPAQNAGSMPNQSSYPQQHAHQPLQHYPTHTQPRMPVAKKPEQPNLMDESPFDINLSSNHADLPTPVIPPNPEKQHILQTLQATLLNTLHSQISQSSSALSPLQSQQNALSTAQYTLQQEIDALQNLQAQLQSNISSLTSTIAAADRTVGSAKNSSSPDKIPAIDDIIIAPTVVARQLYDSVADQRGYEAAIFALTEAFVRGRIGSELWSRKTRECAREEFRRKWLVKRIGRGMGLEGSG